MPESAVGNGLTTGNAPFVEEARHRGDRYITQAYELYSEENQESWRKLYARIRPRWERYGNDYFLRGIEALHLPTDAIPRLSEINQFLKPLTGFQARPVSGYVPGFLFFDCLRRREFPTTITIRPADRMDYLPEPDIFHDVAGHVPMHTDKAFADALVRFGECAAAAAEIASRIGDEHEKLRRLESNIRAMARFFWFSIEFGLMRGPDDTLKAYGSGLLSSYGELGHCIESPKVERRPFAIERVVNQPFEIDHYQPLLFVVDGFDHLYDLADELEDWIVQGRLDDVAGGEPAVSEGDLRSFLEAGGV